MFDAETGKTLCRLEVSTASNRAHTHTHAVTLTYTRVRALIHTVGGWITTLTHTQNAHATHCPNAINLFDVLLASSPMCIETFWFRAIFMSGVQYVPMMQVHR